MRDPIRVLIAGTTAVILALPVAAPSAATPGTGPHSRTAAGDLPASIAALGDSITRGFNACGFYVDCTRRSWTTGDDRDVQSHRLRIGERAASPAQINLARSGASAAALAGQAAGAVAAGADYVTIEIGANDACRSSEDRMTPVTTFRARIDAGLRVLREGAPGARVFVASIPDLYRLWAVGHGKWYVRHAWNKLDVCQSMLARPDSRAAEDEARRDRVRERVRAYNAELSVACAAYGFACRFDRNAVFTTPFSLGQLSKWDFFHPNKAGQRELARVTWEAGFFGP